MSTNTGTTVSRQESADSDVEAFVQAHPDATIYHSFAWSETVHDSFGHQPYYLVARETGRVTGVLPLTHVRTRLFGNLLVSQAFGNYGGPLATSDDARDALFNHAVETGRALGCESIEFRISQPMPYDLPTRTDKLCMRMPLLSDAEAMWNAFSSQSKVRNHVRKAEKNGLTVRIGGGELLDAFYEVYTVRMHELGTPCYSKRLFERILHYFADTARVFLVHLNDLVVGGRLTVCYRDIAESCWGVTRVAYNPMSPNHLLGWSVMKHYGELGATVFDFGRSTVGSSAHLFKKQWGAAEVPLHYQYWSPPDKPVSFLTPDNPKYKRKVELWKKAPLWCTRIAGPWISRGIP